MSTIRAEEPGAVKATAALGVFFAVNVVLSLRSEAGILVLLNLGWMIPIPFLGMLIATTLDTMLFFSEEREPRIAEMMAAITVNLGALVLLLAACWGWGCFGLGRLVGEPSLEETVLTVCFLVGGSGLLLSQRWAGLLVCVTGWWWLSHLLWMRATAPVFPATTVAVSVAALALPLSATVAVSWRHLKSTP